jgi:hypothetical protein
LKLFRQIDNEASLLLHRGFQLGKPCFEFGNTSITLATSLARRNVHTAMLGTSFTRSCASLRKIVNDYKAFIIFHNPVFARSGLGGIPEQRNPHKVIASYARDFELVVLNGHVHTTEIYDVDGVKYLMLGGGGAEQDPILPGRTKIKVPKDYPPDLYWNGQPRKEEYNYLHVDVEPGKKTRFILNRFRPWSAKQFETVECSSREQNGGGQRNRWPSTKLWPSASGNDWPGAGTSKRRGCSAASSFY